MIHLELAPELEAHIAAMAEDHALPVESYVQKIVADHVAANESEAADDLRAGLQEIADGKARPAREVFAELRERYDIQG